MHHRACLRMRAREPTGCMIWRMQTRAYVDVAVEGTAVEGVAVVGVAVEGAAVVGLGVGAGVGLNANSPTLTRQYDSNDPALCLWLAWQWIHASASPIVPSCHGPCVPERIDGRTSASAMEWERAWERAWERVSERHRTE